MIKYHDRTVSPMYGEDGRVQDNWDSEGPFLDDEYIRAYFRLHVPSYFHADREYMSMMMFDNAEDRREFYKEVNDLFSELGWDVSGSPEIWRDKSCLYIHPMYISGIVLKWEVAYIAERLNGKTFILDWVDCYETVAGLKGDMYIIPRNREV